MSHKNLRSGQKAWPDSRSRLSKMKPTLRVASKVSVQLKKVEGELQSLVEKMRERMRQVELVSNFSAILNSSLDPGIVREKALEATCELLKCETASLFLVDPKTLELYWETAINDFGRELKKSIRLPINDQSIAGFVALTGETVLCNDVQKDWRHTQKSTFIKGSFVTKSMICVPLIFRDKVLGVLQAINKTGHGSAPIQASRTGAEFFLEDQTLLQSLSHQVAIAIENANLYTGIKKSFYETAEAMAEAIEKKDRYTGGHTKRVVYYSMCVAKYLNLTKEELERIRLGAVLHDIGKIGIEDRILKKNSPLDESEWKEMQEHPAIGFDIMGGVEGLRDIIGGMKYHHERWDGNGYPEKLKGEEIPLIARIISVADTYDAMVSTRPYRKGLPPKVAYDEITKNKGTQFCPTVVDAFVKAFQFEKMGKGSGGSSLHENDEQNLKA